MDHKTIFSAILAVTLASPGFALAQSPGGRDDRDRDQQAQRDGPSDRRGDGMRPYERGQPSWQARQERLRAEREAARRAERQADRREDRRDERNANRDDDRRGNLRAGGRNDRGVGPNRAWHQGDRVPPQYRSYRYVVDDWRGHRLTAPPSGHHWVQSGGDYVLVAVASGLILSVMLGN
jgi:Ni/Co efflux regulator RcnB